MHKKMVMGYMSTVAHWPRKHIVWFVALSIGVGASFMLAPTHAAVSTTAISQGFVSNETSLAVGTVVSLDPGSQNAVQMSNTGRIDQLIGVIGNKPLIELTTSNSKEVQVVTGGTTSTLVSDINGSIHAGDKITASPINGVGMKADASSLIIGTAQADLNSVVTAQKTAYDRQGHPQTIVIGTIPVQVNVTYYFAPGDKSAFLPPFLQSLANAVAGKEVSPIRVLVSTLVLISGFIGIAVLLYSSTRSGIISIGRNPLSERAVRKSQIEVGATSIGILLVMLIAIYLVLTT